MKKLFSIVLIAVLSLGVSRAQTVLFSEDFGSGIPAAWSNGGILITDHMVPMDHLLILLIHPLRLTVLSYLILTLSTMEVLLGHLALVLRLHRRL
jgi:hypothetical protein